MSKKDYYEVLGVNKDASSEDIKKSYRRLAREYHPDANPGGEEAEAKFKEIKEAYDVLSDPQRRARYDRFGHEEASPGFGGFEGFNDFSSGFEDIFDLFFGGGFSGRRRRDSSAPRRGADLRYEMEISLEDVIRGKETTINIPRSETCSDCGGSGARGGSESVSCSACGGTGQQQNVRNTTYGRFVSIQTCGVCGGRGQVIKERCNSCRGEGKIVRERHIEVKIPAGVDDGAKMRVPGEGEAGERGGPPGDLYVFIRVRPHEFFKRQGNDLTCEVPVSFVHAALGGDIEVPTFEGKAKLNIPEGTQTGTVFRLKGKGVPNLRGFGKGDQLVKVTVEVPRRLNSRQKKILQEFAQAGGAETSAGYDKGFFDRVKDTFGGNK